MKERKLVWDKIPEIIIADGKKPITRILDNDEYLQELDKKLNEEIAEYQSDLLKKWRMCLRRYLLFVKLGDIPLKN